MIHNRLTVSLDRDDVTMIVAALATMRVDAETNAANMAAVDDDMRDDDAIADARAVVADLQRLSDRLVSAAVYAARYR
jgi:hypothetical protein